MCLGYPRMISVDQILNADDDEFQVDVDEPDARFVTVAVSSIRGVTIALALLVVGCGAIPNPLLTPSPPDALHPKPPVAAAVTAPPPPSPRSPEARRGRPTAGDLGRSRESTATG